MKTMMMIIKYSLRGAKKLSEARYDVRTVTTTTSMTTTTTVTATTTTTTSCPSSSADTNQDKLSMTNGPPPPCLPNKVQRKDVFFRLEMEKNKKENGTRCRFKNFEA